MFKFINNCQHFYWHSVQTHVEDDIFMMWSSLSSNFKLISESSLFSHKGRITVAYGFLSFYLRSPWITYVLKAIEVGKFYEKRTISSQRNVDCKHMYPTKLSICVVKTFCLKQILFYKVYFCRHNANCFFKQSSTNTFTVSVS